jgi:hypothetical protein
MNVFLFADDGAKDYGKIYGTMRGDPGASDRSRSRLIPVEEVDAAIFGVVVAEVLAEVRPVEEYHRLLRRHLLSLRTDPPMGDTDSS